jgi:hypothetical protein
MKRIYIKHVPIAQTTPDASFWFSVNFFGCRIPFVETIGVMGLHHLRDKVAGKMFASLPCKLMADYSRTLVSCGIVVHLIQDKLLSLLWIHCLHRFSATNKPKFLSALFNCSRSSKKEQGGK